ncbi:unnamed protein product [Penicillium salamii]|uniref:Uncharacterized protein n=1 Tax=Penicillium salamii TaxID=1612424 RepID=A0A9W4IXD3_9EURO|nr:unnamed protein product [Penicillium salamii]CAG8358786.1 unnamed protein product [Penicillium salamii]
MHIQSVKQLAMESHSYRSAAPTLASLKPTYTQTIGFRTSQALNDEGSRLDVTPVSKQFPLSALNRPSYCDLLLHSSSPVSAPGDEPTTEPKHNGAITEKDSITGAIRGSYTSTGSDHHSLFPIENSKNNTTDLLQNVTTRATFSPFAFNRTSQVWASLETPHSEDSSGPFVESLYHSTSQYIPKLPRSEEPDRAGFSKATEVLAPNGTAATSQTISPISGPTSATKTSDREWHDTAIYGSNLSARLSKQGTVVILSSVFGGSVALIGVFIIHCFILRYLHRHAVGSTSLLPSQRVVDSPGKRAKVIPRTAEFSHFSNET